MLSACGPPAEEPALPAAEAQALLSARRPAFERFEDWATRTASADARFTDRDALAEVAFSPIVRDEAIAYAAIERSGSGDLRLVHPSGASLPELELVPVPLGDGFEVARATIGEGDDAQPVVVLSRVHPLAGDATLRITVAFCE